MDERAVFAIYAENRASEYEKLACLQRRFKDAERAREMRETYLSMARRGY